MFPGRRHRGPPAAKRAGNDNQEHGMQLDPTWGDLALRLILTMVASGALGWDRGEHGRPAGVRTTMLVGLAACIAMIVGVLALSTSGKTGASFAVADVLRMPLGILTGMGFIGAGAILKRGTGVEGLTTASTLWLATVLGTAFGAGFLIVGVAGTVCGFLVVSLLGILKRARPHHYRGTLTVRSDADLRTAIVDGLKTAVSNVELQGATVDRRDGGLATHVLRLRVTYRADPGLHSPPFLAFVSTIPGVTRVEWTM
jgi:putative Mg2+ transporter-C (MgtC) family protein